MFNASAFDIFSATKDVVQDHDSEPLTTGLIEGLSGTAVGIVFLIGIIIAVRKNLEAIQGVLETTQELLTVMLNAIRKRLTAYPPLPQLNPVKGITLMMR